MVIDLVIYIASVMLGVWCAISVCVITVVLIIAGTIRMIDWVKEQTNHRWW